ncbi:hypothetical protein RUW00_08115 [Bacillus sp. IS1]|uniref:hypothetical protein n=1 Tax=Bacillus TaxID=1386 RepID=UPI0028F84EC2|nr:MULTISPECIES: hypothetical protein [Bacillus]MDU0076528.1 hypothetical protein [Bacillus sp. IG2]MDU0101242.1 hypothetical protein [Bacillus sp. IS1]MEC3612000.1 hypothetical protein [Bacillus velezensis]
MKLELANRTIFELLKEAHAKGEMIVTNARQRRLGKTKALMSYAEINQLPVIVPERLKRDYLKRYPKVRILGDAEVTYIDALPLVLLCDEGVSLDIIKELQRLGKLLTGFVLKADSGLTSEQNTDEQGELRDGRKRSLLTKAIHENVNNIVDKELPELEKDLKSAKKKVSVIEKRIAERRELVDEAIKKFGHPIPSSPFEVLH